MPAAILLAHTAKVPTHVLTVDAVRWSIDTLGDRKIHPAFIYYLYLRGMDLEGRLSEAYAADETVIGYLQMPGGPEGKPYYRPLRERGNRPGVLLRTAWTHSNLAGSWGPSSLKRINAAQWLIDPATHTYVLPVDHAAQALKNLLFDQPVSAMAMAAYFLRNDGFFISGPPNEGDLMAAFRAKFRFHHDHDEDFVTLFDPTFPAVDFDWFTSDVPAPAHLVEEDEH